MDARTKIIADLLEAIDAFSVDYSFAIKPGSWTAGYIERAKEHVAAEVKRANLAALGAEVAALDAKAVRFMSCEEAGCTTCPSTVAAPAPVATLRDQFAMAALTGMLASPSTSASTTFRQLADNAFVHADAMLAAREVQP